MNNKKAFATKHSRLIVWGVLGLVLMSNLGAIIDLFSHPEIDYFDLEHIIVGGVTALVFGIMLLTIIMYIYRLEKRSHDISQSEKALRESEAKFKALANTSPLAIYMSVGLEQKAEYVNPTFVRLFGYSVDEVPTADQWWPRAYPDETYRRSVLEEWQYKVEQAIETRSEIVPMEVVVTCKDGSLKNVEWGFKTIGAQNWAFGLDLTERKKAEDKLRESEERYRFLTNNIPDIIYSLDVEGNIVTVNSKAFERYGYTEQDSKGKPFLNFIHPEDREIVIGSFLKAVEEQRKLTQGLQFRIVAGNGFSYWFELNSHARFDSQGNYKGEEGVLRDITARKQAEDALRTSDEKFRIAFTVSPDSININRLQDGMYVTINKGFTQIMGYTPEECVGKTSVELNIWDRPEDRQLLVEGLSKRGEVTNLEARFRTKNGDIKYGLMSAAVVDLNNVKHIISVTHDITERKWAEEALRESDEKFRSLLDSQESNILMLDFDGVHHYVNQVGIASLTASGTAQDIIGKRLHDLYPAHIADWQLEQIRRVITTGQGMSGDFQSVVNDRASWWHLNLQPIRNASGQVVQVMVNSHDITERKQAEEDLRKSENRFHSLYDNASIGMYRTTPDGHILLLNPAGVRMLGYDSLEEITKRNLEEDGFEPGYERIKFHERMKREGDIVGLESVWDKKDGSKIYIRESATAVKDGSGTIIYYDGTFEDITARKQAEEALRESELKYRSLIESSSDAIFCVDEKGQYQFTNQLFASTFAKTPDYFIGKTFWDIYPKEHADYRFEATRRVFQTGESESLEVEVPLPDKTLFFYATANPVKDETGKVILVLTHAVNITERKLAEEALRIKDWAIESAINSIAISDLAGNLTYVNPAFLKLWGYSSPAEVLGKSSTKFWQMGEKAAEIIEELRVQGGWSGEMVANSKEDSLFTVQVAASLVVNAVGQPVCMLASFVNITERKLAEEALHKSEEEFHLLAESMPQIVWVTRPDGWNIYFNQQWVDYTGLTLEESYGDGWNKPFHPDDQQRSWDAWQNATKNNSTYSLECRLRRADGVYQWWLIRGVPQMDAQGNIFKWYGTCTDIHELKLAEERLRESEERYRLLANNVPDIIYSLDGAGNIVTVNSPAFERYGYTEQDSKGRPFLDFIHPEDREIVIGSFLKALEEQRKFTHGLQFRIVAENGLNYWFELNSQARFDSQGGYAGEDGVLRDITERKQNEEVIKETSEQFHTLFEASPEAIMLIDPHDGWRILDCNTVACNMNGYTRDELLGQSMNIFISSPSTPDERKDNLKRIREKGILHFEDLHRRKDGMVFPIEVSTALITLGGREVILGIDRDITERKQIEDTLMFLLQSGYQDDDFFHSLARHLTSSLSMDYVCIDRLAGDQLSAQTLAIYFDGKFDDNVSYTLKDTPCGDVVGKSVCVFPSQVRHLFPLDVVLQEMPAESYVGTTLWSSQGQPIGLIAVIGRKPLSTENQRMAESILKLVAVRAAGELERQQTEEKIREKDIQFRKLSSNVHGLIFQFTRRPDGTYYVPIASEGIRNIFGCSPEDVLEDFSPIGRVIFPEDSTRVIADIEYSAQHLNFFACEFRVQIPGRQIQWIYSKSTPEKLADGSITWYGFNTDITERKQAEEKIHQLNATLEQRVKERTRELLDAQEKLVRHEKLSILGQMASSVGHELRNPLAVITSALYYLKLVQPDADEKIKKYLDMIQQEVRTSEKIITDLLDFARVKSVDREAVSVSELIRQTLERFPVPASVDVSIDIPTDLPRAYVDLRQMNQVLGNLMVNACQAMKDGGNLNISAIVENNFISIVVKDTGLGISAENMKKLFEPLFTTKAKGIGLGLVVSKKLIEANGGRIEVESEAGVGSTFTVWLPVK